MQQLFNNCSVRSFAKAVRFFALLLMPVLMALTTQAQNYAPNTFADPAITSLSNATGEINGGSTISLRSALMAADNLGGTHTVTLGTGTYLLDGSGDYTVPSQGASPFSSRTIFMGNTTQNITINGNGPTNTIIDMDAAGRDRIFAINYDGTTADVFTTVNGVKFTNGYLNFDFYGGAAIYAGPYGGNIQTLTLNNCCFNNNICPGFFGSGGLGGAIYMFQGTLDIDNCSFTNNQSVDGDGGAIIYLLFNIGDNGVLDIANSTFTGNQAGTNGGAISFNSQGSIPVGQTFSANINKNTFLNNTATGYGGAIAANNGAATSVALINYNRFVGNSSTGSASTGGLVFVNSDGDVNAENNWWGCNTGPIALGGCDQAGAIGGSGAGSLIAGKWLQLKTTALPSAICASPESTSTITTGFLSNSANESIAVADLSVLIGLPVNWGPTTLGTLSGQQATIQGTGNATALFTSNGTSGTATVNAQVDNVPTSETSPSRASIDVDAPAITAPGVIQPTCSTPTGTITVNATGTGILEYALNGGSYQISNVFSGLAPGNYNIFVRSQSAPDCVAAYTGNPVTIYAATGCCVPATITCPANQSVNNTPGACSAAVTYSSSTTGTSPTVTYTFTGATTGSGSGDGSGSSFNVGVTNVTLNATNACGSASCSFNVTVSDNQVPSITCPANVMVQCASGVPVPNTALVIASDNCPGVTVSFVSDNITAGDCPNRFTIARTYRATDASNNSSTCVQTITVNDDTAPTITCPAPVTVECASAVPAHDFAGGSASDNCGAVTVTWISDVISGQTCANRYTVTRTYEASDACGNTSSCTQIITVNDNTAPIISCPPAITVQCASAVPAHDFAGGSASDNCGGVTVTWISDVISNQTCANKFTLTRTYTATDACGNASTCTQVITVNDNVNPTITCPPNQTVNPTTLAGAVVTYTAPVGTDNCSGATTTRTAGPASGSTFPIGTTTVTYVVTDACGNTASCSFTVTVTDPYCSADHKKVYVCHNGHTICVSVNALPAHLGHGDNLGPCPTGRQVFVVEEEPLKEELNVIVNTNSKVTANTPEPATEEFRVIAYPNPSNSDFSLQVISGSTENISIRVTDAYGTVVKVNASMMKGSTVKFGSELQGGTYFAEVTQGANRQVVKLVKFN